MFQFFEKNYLGIDIGATSLRVVEVSIKKGQKVKIKNYGEVDSKDFDSPFMTLDQGNLFLSEQNIVTGINSILKEAKTSTKDVFFSLPDFSTFFVPFPVPKIDDEEELQQAVMFEAKKYIPIPMQNIELAWKPIGILKSSDQQVEFLKILAVAIPNEVIDQYQRVTVNCGLKLAGFEPEAFGLQRALVNKDEQQICLIDIGRNSSTINIVDDNTIVISHSINFSGNDITKKIAKVVNVTEKEAERLKIEEGLKSSNIEVKETIMPMINVLVQETDRTFREFNREYKKDITKIIITGSTVSMPGLMDYFQKQFDVKEGIHIGDPFSKVEFDIKFSNKELEKQFKDNLKQMGPRYAVAIGTALRGTEI